MPIIYLLPRCCEPILEINIAKAVDYTVSKSTRRILTNILHLRVEHMRAGEELASAIPFRDKSQSESKAQVMTWIAISRRHHLSQQLVPVERYSMEKTGVKIDYLITQVPRPRRRDARLSRRSQPTALSMAKRAGSQLDARNAMRSPGCERICPSSADLHAPGPLEL